MKNTSRNGKKKTVFCFYFAFLVHGHQQIKKFKLNKNCRFIGSMKVLLAIMAILLNNV